MSLRKERMTRYDAFCILTAHQRWRRALPPYDGVGCLPPCTPREITEAIEIALQYLNPNIEDNNGYSNR